jgi:23S rRNA (uracil1939-C5)-methyltransferase
MPAPAQLGQFEKPIYGGAFLARIEGKAVFVPLALPGEQARVRIVEEQARLRDRRSGRDCYGAPERVAPPCPHFGACGGCQYQHATYAAQLEMKQAILRETLERGGVHAPEEIAVLAGEPWAYRNRIRLAFDASREDAGYRGRRSHAVIPIDECPIAAPVLVEAALAAGLSGNSQFRAGVSEISLFCDAAEIRCWQRLHGWPARFRGGTILKPLPQIPSLRAWNWPKAHQGQPRWRAGAPNPLHTVQQALIIAWITARFSR